MGPSQGSSLFPNVAGLVEGSAIDTLPVYVKELIAGGAAGAFAKTAVAPLERIKILLQVEFLVDVFFFFFDCYIVLFTMQDNLILKIYYFGHSDTNSRFSFYWSLSVA